METHRAEGEQATGGARTFGSTSVNCPLDAGELEVAAGEETHWEQRHRSARVADWMYCDASPRARTATRAPRERRTRGNAVLLNSSVPWAFEQTQGLQPREKRNGMKNRL